MVNAFSYYGMVLYTTVLFRSHDECHGGMFSNVTSVQSCVPLTRSDYFDLLSTSLAEFPGIQPLCFDPPLMLEVSLQTHFSLRTDL